MNQLSGKNIILGVTGSVSAYKAAYLARELQKHDAHVRVVMTAAACRFVTPLTFAALSQHPVVTDMFPPAGSADAAGSWHIDWALWAHAMVIAPASAVSIAKLASGLSDNALTLVATSLRCPLFVAPAMDTDMYQYPALQRNLATLRSYGINVIPPGDGPLASGLSGIGRLAEPAEIVEALQAFFRRKLSLKGRRVLITAGPTHEPIDPVRFIANHSSGKMGYALAGECRDRGAQVTLVSGPASLPAPAGIDVLHVVTAAEMAAAVQACSPQAEIVMAAAAVADFTPVHQASQKLKRRELLDAGHPTVTLELQPTPDILGGLGKNKTPGQLLVGFALETHRDLVESARAKLIEKNCDIVIANSATEEGAGFTHDTNKITVVTRQDATPMPLMSKRECAAVIVDALENLLLSQQPDAGAGSRHNTPRYYV